MTVRIRSDTAVSNRDGAYAFAAEEDHGALEIWVTRARWEQLWLEAPEPATDEDRLDFALGIVEHTASSCEVSTSIGGVRVAFVG